jgi:hypothetical protein
MTSRLNGRMDGPLTNPPYRFRQVGLEDKCRRHAKEWEGWKSATCVLIESMEEKAAYIPCLTEMAHY